MMVNNPLRKGVFKMLNGIAGRISSCSKIEKPLQKNADVHSGTVSFDDILQKELNCVASPDVKFSNHAKSRMNQRNITLDESGLRRLNEGVSKAALRGAKETLIMKDETAFLVNIENKTVITAADSNQLKEKVFTNIDSVIFV